jgi:hypothetical protein
MSGYWNAIERAAKGSSGTAEPRPRARFEPEGDGLDSGIDVFDGEEGESHLLAGVQPSFPPSLLPTKPADPIILDRAEMEKGHEEAAAPAAPDAAPDARSAPISTSLSPGEPAEPSAESAHPEAAEPSPPEIVERLRETLVEHRQTIIEQRVAGEEEPRRQDAVLISKETDRLSPPDQSTHTALEAFPSIALMAEPVVIADESVVPVAQEVPPPPLLVEIGHIEIRIDTDRPVAPAPPSRRSPTPVLSLDAYLAGRSGGPR